MQGMTKRALAMIGLVGAVAATAAAVAQKNTRADPYTLDTCPVSGGKLGSMGEPPVMTIDGREVRFCCAPCEPKFRADTAKHWAAVDAKMADDQRPWYPLTECPLTEHELGADTVEVVVNNRLFRLCCDGCEAELRAEADTHFAALDNAAAEAQRASYPLDTCVVSGSKLGSMGDPHEVVIANRLFRLCCAGCEADLRKNPLAALQKLGAPRK